MATNSPQLAEGGRRRRHRRRAERRGHRHGPASQLRRHGRQTYQDAVAGDANVYQKAVNQAAHDYGVGSAGYNSAVAAAAATQATNDATALSKFRTAENTASSTQVQNDADAVQADANAVATAVHTAATADATAVHAYTLAESSAYYNEATGDADDLQTLEREEADGYEAAIAAFEQAHPSPWSQELLAQAQAEQSRVDGVQGTTKANSYTGTAAAEDNLAHAQALATENQETSDANAQETRDVSAADDAFALATATATADHTQQGTLATTDTNLANAGLAPLADGDGRAAPPPGTLGAGGSSGASAGATAGGGGVTGGDLGQDGPAPPTAPGASTPMTVSGDYANSPTVGGYTVADAVGTFGGLVSMLFSCAPLVVTASPSSTTADSDATKTAEVTPPTNEAPPSGFWATAKSALVDAMPSITGIPAWMPFVGNVERKIKGWAVDQGAQRAQDVIEGIGATTEQVVAEIGQVASGDPVGAAKSHVAFSMNYNATSFYGQAGISALLPMGLGRYLIPYVGRAANSLDEQAAERAKTATPFIDTIWDVAMMFAPMAGQAGRAVVAEEIVEAELANVGERTAQATFRSIGAEGGGAADYFAMLTREQKQSAFKQILSKLESGNEFAKELAAKIRAGEYRLSFQVDNPLHAGEIGVNKIKINPQLIYEGKIDQAAATAVHEGQHLADMAAGLTDDLVSGLRGGVRRGEFRAFAREIEYSIQAGIESTPVMQAYRAGCWAGVGDWIMQAYGYFFHM